MIFFILNLILMVSLGAVLYLMVSALPRVAEAEGDDADDRRSLLDRWAHSEIPEKLDASINGFLLKFLRKFKVTILKLDNAISSHLRKISAEEDGRKPGIDFRDIAEQNKETEE